MGKEKRRRFKIVSFDPDIYYDIVTTAANMGLAIEDVARTLLTYSLTDEDEIKALYEHPIKVRKRRSAHEILMERQNRKTKIENVKQQLKQLEDMVNSGEENRILLALIGGIEIDINW